MATFRIGQRVRIVHPAANNQQATVLSELIPGNGESGPYLGYWIDIDGFGCTFPEGTKVIARDYEIAPLTPPHEAGQWSVIEALCPSLRDMRELA